MSNSDSEIMVAFDLASLEEAAIEFNSLLVLLFIPLKLSYDGHIHFCFFLSFPPPNLDVVIFTLMGLNLQALNVDFILPFSLV